MSKESGPIIIDLSQFQITTFRNQEGAGNLTEETEAFRHEFYQNATDRQIEDDIISYLGEYRFEVPEFDYELYVEDGQLIDPASGEPMVEKARKAIAIRKKEGLRTSREEAELDGLIGLEDQLYTNPCGTVVWFSPPGPEEEGYGRYGFGYVGKKEGDKLRMTAIRVEDPQISDFNQATKALWGEDFETVEDFLRSPKIIDTDSSKVREFIQGNFEIKDGSIKNIFEKVRHDLTGVINEYKEMVRKGTAKERHTALHVIENLSLELRYKYQRLADTGNIVFIPDYKMPTLEEAMTIQKYIVPPPVVRGSCGISGKQESNDIFRSLNLVSLKERDFKFDQPGPCRLCGEDVSCGPCGICESCNDEIDLQDQLATTD